MSHTFIYQTHHTNIEHKIIHYYFYLMCMKESHMRRYGPFRMHVPILSMTLCGHLKKKTLASETSCVNSVVYVILRG
jgi:hypothetical protein